MVYSRKIGTIYLQFGLTSIPLAIHNFITKNEFSFNQLCPNCLAPIKYKRVCPKCGKEIGYHELKSGLKVGDKYFIIDKEKLNSNLETKILAILNKDSEPEYILDSFYLLMPNKDAEKQYFLLLDILLKKNKELLIEYGLRKKLHLAIIKPYNIGGVFYLVLKNIIYAENIRKIPEIDLIEIKKEEMDLGLKLFEILENSLKGVKYSEIKDKRKEKILEMIKVGNKEKVVEEVKKFASLQEELVKSIEKLGDKNKKKLSKKVEK